MVPGSELVGSPRTLRRNFDVRRGTAWCWERDALGFEAVEMKRDRLFHLSLDFVARVARCDATRNVRRVCREAGLGLLNDDQVLHGFKPACLRMLFNVPGAASSPGLPATVTSPGLVVCLNCRCDPRCRTTDQPSSSSILTMSRIFTMRSTPRSACVREQPSAHTARKSPLSHDVPSRTNFEASW